MTATPAHSPVPSISPPPGRTTGIQSVSMPVADQDRALAFYRDVLGCEVRIDTEIWPGARLVEVAPPGSSVGIILLPPDGDIPVAVRLGT